MRRTTASSLLGWSRVGLGAALVLAPGIAARTWFGEDTSAQRLLLRSIGARDLALGAGLLAAPDRQPWLLAGVGADLVDAAASARSVGAIPASKIGPGIALAVAFAAVGAAAARSARQASCSGSERSPRSAWVGFQVS